jgi:hypothetical protein
VLAVLLEFKKNKKEIRRIKKNQQKRKQKQKQKQKQNNNKTKQLHNKNKVRLARGLSTIAIRRLRRKMSGLW